MKALKKWFYVMLLLVMVLATGCVANGDDPSDVTSLEPTGPDLFTSEPDSSEATTVEATSSDATAVVVDEAILGHVKDLIKAQFVWLEYDQLEILEAFNDHFYMVRTEKETFADGYFVYDSKEEKIYLMPIGISYVASYEIVDESKIIFHMTGENSESNYHDVPYVVTCLKAVNTDGSVEFTSVMDKKITPLQESIDFGGKSDHVLTEVIFTLNGIQLGYSPQNPDDAYYYADYTIPPYTQISYDEASHTLMLSLEDTIIGSAILRTVSAKNQYIEAFDFAQNGEDLILKIKLKNHEDYKQLKFYSVEIVNTLNFPAAVNISFYNEAP